MKTKNGFVLVTILLLFFALLTLLGSLATLTLQQKQLMTLERRQIMLRYLAEAGLAQGHYFEQTPGWSTDAQGPPLSQLKTWLLTPELSGGSRGYVRPLTTGGFKVVKIAGQSSLYSIGFIGDDPVQAKYKLVIKEEDGHRFIL
jgi:hypothetical protein